MKQVNAMITIGGSTTEQGEQTKSKNMFQVMTETLSQIAIKLLNNDPQ